MIGRTTFFSATLAVSMGLALFVVKYQVQDLESQLTKIDRQIVNERQALHVLRAEWSHLNEPGRLRDLAVRHLGLVPLEPQQFLMGAAFDMRLGEQNENNQHVETEVQPLNFTNRMQRVLSEGKR